MNTMTKHRFLATIADLTSKLEKVERENKRLREAIVRTDELFKIIDDHFSALPGLVPEEQKIQSMIGKAMGYRIAEKAVAASLTQSQEEER